MKKIACKIKIWFYIIIVLLFSSFMSDSSFSFHVSRERSTFPWLCWWYGRRFFNLNFNSSQRSVTRPNSRKNILEGLVESFVIVYKVNLTLNINTCFDKNVVQTVKISQKMNWEAYLWREKSEKLSLTQPISQIVFWLCRTS